MVLSSSFTLYANFAEAKWRQRGSLDTATTRQAVIPEPEATRPQLGDLFAMDPNVDDSIGWRDLFVTKTVPIKYRKRQELKRAEEAQDAKAKAAKEGGEAKAAEAKTAKKRKAAKTEVDVAEQGCGFVLPRTVCKREIARDEAEVYLKTKNTGLLTEFTSRFGRPFAATLVLKPNGRHGFEFQPREGGRKKGAGKSRAQAMKSLVALRVLPSSPPRSITKAASFAA